MPFSQVLNGNIIYEIEVIDDLEIEVIDDLNFITVHCRLSSKKVILTYWIQLLHSIWRELCPFYTRVHNSYIKVNYKKETFWDKNLSL